jgi:hypothetical protein
LSKASLALVGQATADSVCRNNTLELRGCAVKVN